MVDPIEMTINGLDIVIVDDVISESTRVRPWVERLFSLPFRPLKKIEVTKVISPLLADGDIVRSGNSLLMNERTWIKIKEATYKRS